MISTKSSRSQKVKLSSRRKNQLTYKLRKIRPIGEAASKASLSSRWMLTPPVVGYRRGVGRNHHGRITRFHRGGGASRAYRPLKFRFKHLFEGQALQSLSAVCQAVVYDPNRTAFIGLFKLERETQATQQIQEIQEVQGSKDTLFWRLAPLGLREGDRLVFQNSAPRKSETRPDFESDFKSEVSPVRTLVRQPLRLFEPRRLVHAIRRKGELGKSGKFGQFGTSETSGKSGTSFKVQGQKGTAGASNAVMVRAAGRGAEVLAYFPETDKVLVRLPSGQRVNLAGGQYATSGRVSNPDHYLGKLTKAGQSRHLGRRPIVRGVAMNPVDHPHGGRTSGGRPSVTPWGRLTKSWPTVRARSDRSGLSARKAKKV